MHICDFVVEPHNGLEVKNTTATKTHFLNFGVLTLDFLSCPLTLKYEILSSYNRSDMQACSMVIWITVRTLDNVVVSSLRGKTLLKEET